MYHTCLPGLNPAARTPSTVRHFTPTGGVGIPDLLTAVSAASLAALPSATELSSLVRNCSSQSCWPVRFLGGTGGGSVDDEELCPTGREKVDMATPGMCRGAKFGLGGLATLA